MLQSIFTWHDCDDEVHTVVQQIVVLTQEMLKDKLLSVYLHGSLSMGCFNPAKSDIDLLIVVKESLLEKEKLNLAASYLSHTASRLLEVNVITQHAASAYSRQNGRSFSQNGHLFSFNVAA